MLGAAVFGALLGVGPAAGAAFGLASLAGDLASAFAKRRLGLASGSAAPLLDQLPEALLPLLLLRGHLGLGTPAVLGTALAFTLLDLVSGAIRARWARSESG
ncbi:MAG: CDP-archaeol synthase [Steroidobacteraceae bacterium]